MPLEVKNLKNIDKQKVGFFRFKELNGQYLITNDIGDYSLLTSQEFDLFVCGKIEETCPEKYSELQNKGFIRDRLDFDGLSQRYVKKNIFLGRGTSLHIVVVTLRCDHRCIYCQADSQGLKAKGLDMDIPTAKKVVDRIFESPSRDITIEFQGGESLVNFNAIKFIVGRALKKNKKTRKNLLFTIVSNLTFMNEKIARYILENNIHICTSLDGPERIHNRCRLVSLQDKNSYKNTVTWLKRLREEYKKRNLSHIPSALTTVTRYSLLYPRQIVDEYVNLGMEGIHLRPVNPFGISVMAWKNISYPTEDFIKFYRKALDYIIDLNLKGKDFKERFALVFLTKILTDRDPNYLDIRSPCGAGIGQLAYNFNGDIYTCDEGRMLSRRGDESFRIGNVKETSYQNIKDSEIVKTMCISSCLDVLPGCNQCVYKPYCGVCPLYNYATDGNIFTKNLFLCKMNTAILDYLFIKLRDERIRALFYRWTGQ